VSPARVALVGLGPIGLEVGRALAARGIALVGAADPAPGKVGADVRDLLGVGVPVDEGIVAASAADVYARARAGTDVAVLCTGSRLEHVVEQIEEAVHAGLHVVSTCEELAYPALRHGALARKIDERARAAGVVVLGTGVNPGLVMDRLALAAVAGCVRVDHVRVERVVDAAKRRGPLRAKVGAGITAQEFRAGVDAGHLGHVGLAESAALLARGLGHTVHLSDIEETVDPVIETAEVAGVAPGLVLGVRQSALVRVGGVERVRLDLQMSVGAQDPHDRIVVAGDPPLDVVVAGGYQGDRATVGAVVNAVGEIGRARPGLRTVVEVPLFGLGI
jgi:4-hydroxy-tetrahydrodipicolinate reductase